MSADKTKPKFSLIKMRKSHEKLRSALIANSLSYRNINIAVYASLCEIICDVLKIELTEEIKTSILSILSKFAGGVLDNNTVTKLCDTIVGLEPCIRKGKTLQLWVPNAVPLWSCFKVVSVEPMLSRTPGRFICTIKAYADKAVGESWKIVANRAYALYFIRKCGGSRNEKYNPEDMSGLWFTAIIRRGSEKIEFSNIFMSSSQRSSNKKLLQARSGKCLGYIPKANKCFDCWVGQDICSLSRHELTYIKGECKSQDPAKHIGYLQKAGFCMHCIKKMKYLKYLGEKHV